VRLTHLSSPPSHGEKHHKKRLRDAVGRYEKTKRLHARLKHLAHRLRLGEHIAGRGGKGSESFPALSVHVVEAGIGRGDSGQIHANMLARC
jgi:hypothetical protein